VLDKAKSAVFQARKLVLPDNKKDLTAEDVQKARQYIASYWKELERFHPNDDKTLVGLPYPYLIPSQDGSYGFNELYYWDSYFMVQSMLDKDHVHLVKGIVEDFLTLLQRFHIIPNASRTYFTGRSQPPLLTSFIFDVYKIEQDKTWLEKAIAIAKEEYENVWMGTAQPNWRQVYQGLSRYYDINTLHDLAEAESGWDMTTRFGRRALNYLPVDLNALLYKYETDFAKAARILGNEGQALDWQAKADIRKKVMDELMWSKTFGIYYDYNFKKEKRGTVSSLATFYPMWAGMVSEKQAAQLVKTLKRFEEKGGLATTDGQMLSKPIFGGMPVQWAHPNGWAPLHFIVVEGLERYGYHEDAERIARKWLRTNLDWFNKHNEFLEKYNVVSPSKPAAEGVYPSQVGFGWTNAIFERFCQDYIDQ
jgi:alpha,alpha-trehalase